MQKEDKDWLASCGVDISRNAVHDAAGINDNYPVGKGVFIDEQSRYIILVNIEDHIEVVILLKKMGKIIEQ